jgi:hypothetical protein
MNGKERVGSQLIIVVSSIALLAGSASGQEKIWKTFGDHADQEFGLTVGSVGDLTGDGIPDVLIGQPVDPGNASSSGMVRVLSGVDGSTVYSILGVNQHDWLGSGVAGLSDIDGDGACDFIIGAPGVDTLLTDQGAVYAYSGRTGVVIYAAYGAMADGLGGAIAALGDIDGDGVGDFVAGSGANYAKVFSGANGSPIWTLIDPKTPVFFGYTVGGGGDVDADGVPDIVVGDYFSSAGVRNGGAVWVFSGNSGSLLHEFDSSVKDAKFGKSVSIPGDVNADGFADVLVGAPFDSHIVSDGGYAAVFSGHDGSLLLEFNADSLGNITLLGNCVGGAGDANDDGFADLLVSCTNSAAVFLYSGKDGGLLYHFQDESNLGANAFGTSFAAAGDLDSDGHVDFVINATFEDNGLTQDTGSVSAWRGRDFFVDTTPRVAVANQAVVATIGQAIAGNPYALFLRDINGTPMFTLLGVSVLDMTGRAFLAGTIPFGLGANSLQLQAFTLDANNKLVESGIETFYTQ